jgi:hypothetical protein
MGVPVARYLGSPFPSNRLVGLYLMLRALAAPLLLWIDGEEAATFLAVIPRTALRDRQGAIAVAALREDHAQRGS